MSTELEPIVGNWYAHLDKGQRFMVAAVDEDAETVDMQHFDGDIEELSFSDWYQLDLEIIEEPEDWSGAMDIADVDDYGTEITDTADEDWSGGLAQFRESSPENLKLDRAIGTESAESVADEEDLEPETADEK